MLTLEVRNEIAVKHGYKDFNDLWWNGDITLELIEDMMLGYGLAKERQTVDLQNRLINLSNIDKS